MIIFLLLLALPRCTLVFGSSSDDDKKIVHWLITFISILIKENFSLHVQAVMLSN